MARINHRKIENRVRVCREYTELWQSYFQFFADDLAEVHITDEMETEYENIVNILALNHYKFQELCGEYMKDSGEVLKILAEGVSLDGIKSMPEATLSKMQVSWHTTFLEMNKALGKLLAQMSPKAIAAMQAAENGQSA